jgi:von Willebrand factor A domain-containing protein 8
MQKYKMGQDIILLGLPSSLRRRMIVSLAEANGWEVEYLAITKDTTESDLKQRREIIGDSAIYSDQAPVRAAIHGRVLILDGIENAERNVLPTLNNLLENREMALDDGRFLMPRPKDGSLNNIDTKGKLVFVDDRFRVVALGLPVPPYTGRTMDPPLRSRFQVILKPNFFLVQLIFFLVPLC